MKEYFIDRVKGLLSRVTLSCLDKDFQIVISYDKKQYELFMRYNLPETEEPRVYIKITCMAENTLTGVQELQHGRKWYLSEHMTDDEIIKGTFGAFERFVNHEVKEGFKVDGKRIYNPHTDFEELLKICEKEVKREEKYENT